MQTPMLLRATPSTSATNYCGFSSTWQSAENVGRNVAPIDGLIEGIRVHASTAPGGAASYTFTLRKNGVATDVSCTILGSQTSCQSLKSVSISAGDYFSIESVPSGTPASSAIHIGSIFNSGNSGMGIFIAADSNSAPATGTNEVTGIMGRADWSTSSRSNVMPIDGMAERLYVLLTTAPGADNDYQFRIRKNSSATNTSVILNGLETTSSDTANAFSFVAGDALDIQSIPFSSPSSTRVTFSLAYTPTTLGDAIQGMFTANMINSSVESYTAIQGTSNSFSTSDTATTMISPGNFIAKKLRVSFGSAPGSGTSFALSLRQNAVTSDVTCTASGASGLTCSDTTHEAYLSPFDLINFQAVPSGTPTSSTNNKLSLVMFSDPNTNLFDSTIYDSTIY
jgi:hypothetical protein